MSADRLPRFLDLDIVDRQLYRKNTLLPRGVQTTFEILNIMIQGHVS